jgi:hypothetical protein
MNDTPEKEAQDLNPQIASAKIGKRYLREITIYPLSLGDQVKFTDVITEGINAFFQAQETPEDMAVVGFFVDLIKENIPRLMGMITDGEDKEKLLEDMTNIQAVAIAEHVYNVNYDSISKNLKSLVGKVSKLFLSERPSPLSVNDTDTPSNIVSEEATGTEG